MRRMGIGLGVGINRSNYAQGIFGAYATRVVADGGVVEGGACVDAVSGLLQTASLLLIPSGYKSGKAYAEIPTNGNGDLTWTRTSTAIRTNSSGLLESMGSGVPRLSYMYGSCPSVLLEPQRTNLVTYSEQFDNSAWRLADITVTPNTTISPNGTSNADTIVEGVGVLTQHRIDQQITITTATNYSVSVYVKRLSGTRDFALLNVIGGERIYYNMTTNTVANSVLGTGTITSVGNGWYRLTASGISSGTSTTFYLAMCNGTTTGSETYTGDGTSSFAIYGAQLEAGAYPTTYIPTTGSATATRVADSFSRSNIYTNGLITSSGGTWFVELRGNVNYIRDGYSQGLLVADNTMSGGVSGNGLQIRIPATTSQRLSIQKVIGGTNTQLYLTTTDTTKIAIKWNGTTADVFANGVKVVSATAFTPTNMEFLAGSGSDVPKFIQQMALFPTPLSDTELTQLTTL